MKTASRTERSAEGRRQAARASHRDSQRIPRDESFARAKHGPAAAEDDQLDALDRASRDSMLSGDPPSYAQAPTITRRGRG